MGWRSLSLAAGLAATAVAAGCTDGTTPDCSDAQCQVVDAVEGGADGGSGDAGSGEDAADAKSEIDAGEDAPASTVDAASRPDAASGPDAASNPGDAASHPADGGDSG